MNFQYFVKNVRFSWFPSRKLEYDLSIDEGQTFQTQKISVGVDEKFIPTELILKDLKMKTGREISEDRIAFDQ